MRVPTRSKLTRPTDFGRGKPVALAAVVIAIALSPILLAGPDPCVELSSQIESQIGRYRELLALFDELNTKFESYVKDDFQAQTDNIIDEIHRNAAIKVAYDRKRLMALIRTQEQKIQDSKSEFCAKCAKGPFAASNPTLPCQYCPGARRCK